MRFAFCSHKACSLKLVVSLLRKESVCSRLLSLLTRNSCQLLQLDGWELREDEQGRLHLQ